MRWIPSSNSFKTIYLIFLLCCLWQECVSYQFFPAPRDPRSIPPRLDLSWAFSFMPPTSHMALNSFISSHKFSLELCFPLVTSESPLSQWIQYRLCLPSALVWGAKLLNQSCIPWAPSSQPHPLGQALPCLECDSEGEEGHPEIVFPWQKLWCWKSPGAAECLRSCEEVAEGSTEAAWRGFVPRFICWEVWGKME